MSRADRAVAADIAEVPELPGVDPRLSRVVRVRDHGGQERRWHLLDSAPLLAERGVEPVGTLLAVHGNPTFSFLFRSLVREDIPWRLIAVDQLEMGWSERTGVTRRLQDRVTDLSMLTDSLSLTGPVVTVGHDWGGLVSAGWALDNRHDVAGMIMTNTGVYQELDQMLPAALQLATAPAVLPVTTSLTDAFLRTTLALHPQLDAETRSAYLAPYRSRARRLGIETFVDDIPASADDPSRPTLERIAEGLRDLQVPSLFVWGPKDVTFGDRFLRDLIHRVPHADVHRVEGASHLVWEDTDVAGIVATWLADHFGPEAHELRPVSAGAEAAPEMRLGAEITRLGEDPVRRYEAAVVEMSGGPDGQRREITWAMLSARVDDIAAGLLSHGVRPGERVSILVPPGADLTAILYACLRIGAVAVIADAGLGVQGLTRAVIGSHPDWIIGIPTALTAARTFGWPGRKISVAQLPTLDRTVLGVDTSIAQLAVVGRQMRELGAPLQAAWPRQDDDAAVLFTSGSTGPAKGAVYTHRQMGAMFAAVGDTLRLDPDRGLVAGFAPFALLGPALGAPSVVPDMDITRPGDLTATALADAVDALGSPAVFTAPAALRNLLDTAVDLDPHRREVLARVPSYFSAGAPIPAAWLAELREVMPAARALTPYGMTECLAITAIDLEGIEEAGPGDGVVVGRPVPRVEVAIAELDGTGATTGTITDRSDVTGEILVKAPHVRDRYLMLWDTTRKAGRFPGWHATGDVGHLDAGGRLWVEGRTDHVLATAEGIVTPVRVEAAAESVPTVRRAGAAAVGPRGTQQIVVVLETVDGYRPGRPATPRSAQPALQEAVRRAVSEATGAEVVAVFTTRVLPTDIRHNSKIDRARLSRWAEQSLAGRVVPL